MFFLVVSVLLLVLCLAARFTDWRGTMWEFVEDITEVFGWLMLYVLCGLGLSVLVWIGFKGVM